MSVEFLASNEVKCRCHPPMNCTVPKWVKFNLIKVRDTLLNCGLSPAAYRFPRVFGDEFGDEFGDSLNFVSKLVTHLVMISVNHCIW